MSCISQNKQPTDIEDLGRLIHNQRKIANKRFQVKDADKPRFSQFATELCSNESLTTKKQIGKYWHTLMRKYHITPSKTKIRLICKEFDIGMPPLISDYLIKKKGRSMSGIVSIGVSTKPLNSCSYKCSYCPTPLDSNNKLYVPKSYDETEGAIARGLRNHWKGHFQIYERGNTLTNIGHIMDKLEIIVRGGTFHCYSEKYQIHFITELYYGANTFYAQAESEEYLIMRKMLSLEEEIEINKGSKCRVIGLTLETRPDFAIKNFSRIHLNPEDNNRFIERRLVRIIRNLRRLAVHESNLEFSTQTTLF